MVYICDWDLYTLEICKTIIMCICFQQTMATWSGVLVCRLYLQVFAIVLNQTYRKLKYLLDNSHAPYKSLTVGRHPYLPFLTLPQRRDGLETKIFKI